MTRVMIALDGTELDEVVAPAAHRLFGDDAEFLAVNVRSSIDSGAMGAQPAAIPVGYGGVYPYRLPDVYSLVDRATSEEMSDEAQNIARRAADASGMDDAEAIGLVGEPDVALRRAAEAHRADVIVIGTHNRSWWSKLVRPSVSDSLLDDSSIPILLVNDPAQ